MDNINEKQLSSTISPLALGGAFTGILILIVSIIYLFVRSPSSSKTNDDEKKSEHIEKKQTSSNKPTASKAPKLDSKSKFVHPWLSISLRAHSGSVTGLGFSHNDKYLASVAEGLCDYLERKHDSYILSPALDDSVLLWPTKDFEEKDHK